MDDDGNLEMKARASQMWKQEYQRKRKAVVEGSCRNNGDSGETNHGNDVNYLYKFCTQKTREAENADNFLQCDVDSLAINMERSDINYMISCDETMISPKGSVNLVEISVIIITGGLTNSKTLGSWKRLNKEGIIRHGIKE